MPGIEIHGHSSDVFLTVSLADIMLCFSVISPDVKWRLYSLDVWTDSDIPELSAINADVLSASNGILVDKEQIKMIAATALQVVNIILVGGNTIEKTFIDENYRATRDSYDYYIELFDSSFFIIYSRNDVFISCLKNRFDGIKFLE